MFLIILILVQAITFNGCGMTLSKDEKERGY